MPITTRVRLRYPRYHLIVDMTIRSPPEERSPAELLRFGVINLDKPSGPSSHQIAQWFRDMTAETLEAKEQRPISRCAHGGTLDPKVTGCLPLLLGDATRLAQVFLRGEKEYVTVFECHRPLPADFDEVISEFEGDIYQKPPKKSAVNRRLRTRTVHEIETLERTERRALLRIRCESGTYIRKLCHDIGLAIGTGGHMGDLRRIGTDPFDDTTLQQPLEVVDALAYWREDDDPSAILNVVQPGERALQHLPHVRITDGAAESVAAGSPVFAPGIIDGGNVEPGSFVVCTVESGTAVCLGRVSGPLDANEGEVIDLERVLL